MSAVVDSTVYGGLPPHWALAAADIRRKDAERMQSVGIAEQSTTADVCAARGINTSAMKQSMRRSALRSLSLVANGGLPSKTPGLQSACRLSHLTAGARVELGRAVSAGCATQGTRLRPSAILTHPAKPDTSSPGSRPTRVG